MNTRQLNESEVLCGVDTVELLSETESRADLAGIPYVRSTAHERLSDGKYKYVVNTDTALDERNIYEFSLYSETLDKMICEMELTHPTKNRIDFRFDRFDSGSYNRLLKLNMTLIMLVGMKYKVKNRYLSEDMLTGQDLTARIQNRYFEMEYYHKALQQPKGNVDSRLELRSKNIEEGADEAEELSVWFGKRLKKAVSRQQYTELQELLNAHLWERYQEEIEKYPNMKTNEFLFKHRMRILTKAQLTDFYTKLGYKSPSECARRYINRKKLETVSYSLIEAYIDQLKEAAERFMNS